MMQVNLLQSQLDKDLCDGVSCTVRHDLEVYQIEIEMKNRELREAQIQIEEARDNYADLYDFSPVNYFTFDEKGIIKNINLTAASMLGKVGGQIIGRPFLSWLEKESIHTFRKHLAKTFQSDSKVFNE